MSPANVLIVEDEAIAAMATAAMLRKLGFTVCGKAASGEEALLLLDDKCPDLIIMDIRLEGELDGIETTRRLKMHRDVPVIFVTAYTDETTRSRAQETKPLAFINKPLDITMLQKALAALPN